jgi:hypothetical protein
MGSFRYGIVAALLLCAAPPPQRSYVDWYQEMAAAYQAGDNAAMARAAEGALSVRPRFPSMMVNLALARIRLGEHDAALDLLDEVAAMGLSYPIDDLDQLALLQESARFRAIAARMRANAAPQGDATVAFTLPQRDFFPEGIAVDPDTGALFVSGVRRGEIVRVDAEQQEPRLFARLPWSALGMRVDRQRSLLWVAISGLAQRQDLAPDRRGRAGFAALDLDDGALLSEYLLPAGTERVVGDLVVGADGSVYATDSIAGGVWVLRPGTDTPVPLLPDGSLASPQGLDFAAGALYVAAYNGGILRIDPRLGSAQRLTVPDDVSVYGIDGLYAVGGGLVAVQNGITPHRVVHLSLDGRGLAISGATVLLAADPRFGEPTLGVVADGLMYMVANSPWAQFSDPAQPPDSASLPLPTVLRLQLSSRPGRPRP